MEDITFCYAGLMQKYDTAYNIVRLEIEDPDKETFFTESMYQELKRRGLSDGNAKAYSSRPNAISSLMENIETYAQIFERIREKLLVRTLNSKTAKEEHGKCLNCNFAILDI